MGGKHKQAQRIKNNARPSSSGRSAELLASSSTIPQFSSTKEIRFIPPTLSLLKTEEFDSAVSPDFQIVFKKMNKKDSTTKLKALQEFSDLIQHTEVGVVKAILPFWATLYGILATDTDHRIREAVHNSHQQIIKKDKKSIAPFLKQLIGPWFTSQYDTYAPAATAASAAFNAAFPPNKIQDCVLYCEKEILSYVFENVTSKVDTDPRHGTNDDAEAKFERVVVSSLQGYALYLNTLSSEQIEKTGDLNGAIIANQRFLKLAHHKSHVIRASWFRVLATLYHKAGALLGAAHAQFVPLVFGNLDEGEPGVVNFVWEAALLIMDFGQEWWKYIHVEKHFQSKLRKVLRQGGQGNASIIYPNLLSILHNLPPVVTPAGAFYESFFENLRLGLQLKLVTGCKSESTAVITALIECLKYVIVTNQDKPELNEKLIKCHLLTLLEWSLNEPHAPYRAVFAQISSLVQYWSKNPKFDALSTYFWSNLQLLMHTVILANENTDLLDRHVVFVQQLKNIDRPRERPKVKFSSDVTDTDAPKGAPLALDISDVYIASLDALTYKMLTGYVTLVEEKRSCVLIPLVFSIVRLFESVEFLRGLAESLRGGGGSIGGIYREVLQPWLKSPDLECESVVDLVFVLIKHVEKEEKTAILESLLEFNGSESFGWCIKNAFSHPFKNDPVVSQWIRNDKVGQFLISVAEKNLQEDCPASLKLLFRLSFAEDNEGDLLIEQKTVTAIIKKLQDPLENPQKYLTTIDTCIQLASHIAQTLYTEDNLLKCDQSLLLALFQFTIGDHAHLEHLTNDTLWEAETSWHDAITILSESLPKDTFIPLALKFAQTIQERFLTETDLSQLILATVNFIKATYKGQPTLVASVYNQFFDSAFDAAWRSTAATLCQNAEHLNGGLNSITNEIIKTPDDISEDDLLKFFAWNFVNATVLATPLEEPDEDDDDVAMLREIAFGVSNPAGVIADLLHNLATGQSFLNYKMTRNFALINDYVLKAKDKVKLVLGKLQLGDAIKERLAEMATSQSWFWTSACLLYCDLGGAAPAEMYGFVAQRGNADLRLIQVFGRFLDFDRVQFSREVAHDCVILRSLLHCDEIDVQIAEVFDQVKRLRNKDIPRFLYESKDLSWSEAEEVIEVVRLFSAMISDKFACMNRQHWDFAVISLSSWAANCCKLRSLYGNEQVQCFMVAVVDFFINLNNLINGFKINKFRNSYVDEWDDIFLPNIHGDLLQLWLFIAEQFASKEAIPLNLQPFLHSLARIVDHFTHTLIFNNKGGSIPGWSKILKRCCNLLIHPLPAMQLCGYKMLVALLPGLIEIDLQTDSSNTPNAKGYTLNHFKETLAHAHTIVYDVLQGFKLGEDSCQVSPFTDSYTYVYGYLLLWDVIFTMCEKAPPELRYQYADSLRNENYLKSLLNNLFKLMPLEILHHSDVKAVRFSKSFLEKPSHNFKESCTSEQLEHMVCWVYTCALSQLPALVRQWWSETESKVTQIVERITTLYVSPQLCVQELSHVADHETKFKNMTIRVVQSVREVIAVYTVDEAQMELVITLPQNYPLGGPDVRCNKQIGGALHKQWLMQLKKYLLHQNGRVWDGLSLWNNNLDKKFDGVEECYICFAVLHPGTYQLPKLSCQTCKKKFHSACLYKWFSTSNKSSCPICRNLF